MMDLKLLLPFGIFRNAQHVSRIVVETDHGSFGLLPHRQDCVAAITPGILIYQCACSNGNNEPEIYVAVDAGILIKTGSQVVVSVRHAIAGNNLAQLHDIVEQSFMQENTQDQNMHSVIQKMESDFMRKLTLFRHDN